MKRLLLVDDDAAILETLADLLQDKYQVVMALDGAMALRILETDDRFDLVLLDLMMPVVDGETFKQKLDERHNRTPVILISASNDLRKKALEMGVTDYMSKPFNLDALELKIERALGRTSA